MDTLLLATVQRICIQCAFSQPRLLEGVFIFGNVKKYCFNVSEGASVLNVTCTMPHHWMCALPDLAPPLVWEKFAIDDMDAIGIRAHLNLLEELEGAIDSIIQLALHYEDTFRRNDDFVECGARGVNDW